MSHDPPNLDSDTWIYRNLYYHSDQSLGENFLKERKVAEVIKVPRINQVPIRGSFSISAFATIVGRDSLRNESSIMETLCLNLQENHQ
ncbi:hypothetical protein [Flavobacterium sp. PS2]|uniref:hypothetical protein n=1 Tax=Flavobacterium sp. PS2 TaxID=3384157 RepID=UPI00390C9DAE